VLGIYSLPSSKTSEHFDLMQPNSLCAMRDT
jgi:hypothetical protein